MRVGTLTDLMESEVAKRLGRTKQKKRFLSWVVEVSKHVMTAPREPGLKYQGNLWSYSQRPIFPGEKYERCKETPKETKFSNPKL